GPGGRGHRLAACRSPRRLPGVLAAGRGSVAVRRARVSERRSRLLRLRQLQSQPGAPAAGKVPHRDLAVSVGRRSLDGTSPCSVATGVLAGLAVATKLPAAYLFVSFLVLAIGGGRRRYEQGATLVAIAAFVWLVTWLPLGAEVTKAWHFMAAMQLRHSGAGA